MTATLAEIALPDTGAGTTAPDPHSQRWLDGLRSDGARHDQCARELHAVLLRAARREIHRRRGWLGGAAGPELDDLAHQTADDALVAIINNLDSYRGASRFTTWAYRFVMNQASIKTRRHLWSGRRVEFDDVEWARLPNRLGASPHRHSEQHAQLQALREAVEHGLSTRQREVFRCDRPQRRADRRRRPASEQQSRRDLQDAVRREDQAAGESRRRRVPAH